MELHVGLCCAVPNGRWVEYIPQLDAITGKKLEIREGRAYEQNGDLDKALENYRKAISLNSNYPTAYSRAGIVYMRKADTASATTAFDNAEIEPIQENRDGKKGHARTL